RGTWSRTDPARGPLVCSAAPGVGAEPTPSSCTSGSRAHGIASSRAGRGPRARGGRMPTVAERVAAAVAPVLDELGLLLHDVEHTGTSLRVVVDRDEPGAGVDVDALTAATRAISRLLDDL